MVIVYTAALYIVIFSAVHFITLCDWVISNKIWGRHDSFFRYNSKQLNNMVTKRVGRMLKFTRPQMSDDLIYSPYRNMWFAPVEIFTLIASTRQRGVIQFD